MAESITMPKLGESVTEGTITKWLVSPGDTVKKYDPIAEVMTDKVNAEVPSSFSGTIKELVVNEDTTVEVGEVICLIETEESSDSSKEVKEDPPAEEEEKVKQASSPEEKQEQPARFSPAVLNLSQKYGVDLSQLKGSGRGGRITRKDVEAAAEKPAPSVPDQKESAPAERTVEKQAPADGRVKDIPVSGVRKAIADNMAFSKQNAPHAWMMIEVDVTDLVRWREKNKERFYEQEGVKLTYMPFFMQAVTEALRRYPQVNSSWQNDTIRQYQSVHLSIAAASEDALYVPVIKDTDQKNLRGLARSLDETVNKVKKGTLDAESMRGGTFTLNNTGAFGSIQSQPILNPPQAAILSVEAIVKRPVVLDNDAIAVRHMVNLCMSLDHRVLDGLICGRFLQDIKETLESDPETKWSLT
ncbi:dihydrolipoamide acetyltransferase family protein [Alkalicoccus urumqiensis]|uniref:Dihydrolipoamide acetyltransferase component of pyruvate dehydrogenase complex n=1 Tax=Alkalicoccus urumqiensis TaxID=1548213 RepID=A0A2P6MKD1_ALKUR|nr:dihydrolipoamide acetyltransferase family protein [Alkalicoccus urumqiensis]PRO66728.1 branched-chain alpha-keto acid dehydrogenase subunit E2 [Alkalicoccus urumqiensis]